MYNNRPNTWTVDNLYRLCCHYNTAMFLWTGRIVRHSKGPLEIHDADASISEIQIIVVPLLLTSSPFTVVYCTQYL